MQSCYNLSDKNYGAKLTFLFYIGLSRLTNKLSLISSKNMLVPEPKWWNHQMRGHGYEAKWGHVLNSQLTGLLF